MSRIQKLETHYQEQLKKHQIKDVSEFIQTILDVDITKGKYARFLIEAFLNDKFLEEDLIGGLDSTVGQAISLFDKHKSKLPENMRSVYALNQETGEVLYQSPGDLWNSVKQYQGELSGKELKKEEQEKIYRETEFVYKDEETGFQIVSPLTEESAKWWGKGTRWCTSADKNNMFWNYAEKAPLFILLMPNGDKLQVWKNGNQIQFMDESDNDVTLDYIEQHWTILEPICLWLNDIKYIPEKYLTLKLCELAVKQNGMALQYVPEHLKTKELYELAVQQNGDALFYIPKELRTPDLCNMAISNNEHCLQYVPDELITPELCKMIIQQNGDALQFIPEKYKNKELCKIAIEKDGMALEYIPKELRTKELCEIAVKNNGLTLYYIPENIITEELCKIAVKQNEKSLQCVPLELRTKELCELVVTKNDSVLEYVPEEYIKPGLYEIHFNLLKENLKKTIIKRSFLHNDLTNTI